MPNVLPPDKQTAAIATLAEGSSIRSIERITGIHRDTIMRPGVKVGQGYETLLDSKMQDSGCRYLQFDEVWGFIGEKERHVHIEDNPEAHDTDEPDNPRRHVIVLHLHPIKSARDAVRAAIV